MKIAIESRNVGMTPRWKNEIEARMADLQRGCEDLTHGRVTLTKNPHHKKSSNVAEARCRIASGSAHVYRPEREQDV